MATNTKSMSRIWHDREKNAGDAIRLRRRILGGNTIKGGDEALRIERIIGQNERVIVFHQKDTTNNPAAVESYNDGSGRTFIQGLMEFDPVGQFMKMEGIPQRYRLAWVAGQYGKPGLNADLASATESVRVIADRTFEILGTNATSALCTYNVEGGLTITTAGADADSMIILPHLDVLQTAWALTTWGTDRSTRWECFIQSGANITNAIIWAGLKLTNTPVTATDADQVFFRYEDDVISGDWQAVSSIGGTDDALDTNIAVAVTTQYHLVIVIDSARLAKMYINGVLVKTTAALTSGDLIPYIGVEADGAAAAKAISVYGQAISRIAA